MKKFFIFWAVVLIFGACNNIEQENVADQIRDAKYCQVDSDCINIGSSCPFGCDISVNKNEKSDILEKIKAYEIEAEKRGIQYSCEPCPFPGWIQCNNGFCTTLYE